MFYCDKCGLCCKKVYASDIYANLNRGDGICKYYDDSTRLCKIYNRRPLMCNVDLAYEKIFKHIMTKEEYYNANYKACKLLKSKEFNNGIFSSKNQEILNTDLLKEIEKLVK